MFSSQLICKPHYTQTYSTSQIVNIICYTSLAVWEIPEGWRWTCYIISGAGYGLSGLCMAYVMPSPESTPGEY